MFKAIRKYAVQGYKKELRGLLEFLQKLSKEDLSDLVVYSAWTRAGLQLEGHFVLPGGKVHKSAELTAYPFMLKTINGIVNNFRKKGLKMEASGMSIWQHTLRGISRPELRPELKKLWGLLMSSRNLWKKDLDKIYNEKQYSNISIDTRNDTLELARAILRLLPPKEIA